MVAWLHPRSRLGLVLPWWAALILACVYLVVWLVVLAYGLLAWALVSLARRGAQAWRARLGP